MNNLYSNPRFANPHNILLAMLPDISLSPDVLDPTIRTPLNTLNICTRPPKEKEFDILFATMISEFGPSNRVFLRSQIFSSRYNILQAKR
jgi:hypothetical protein